MTTIYVNSEYLSHHGIKGMKWGVRRYQNEDGSLTEAGKKRQARIDASDKKYREKQKHATAAYYDKSKFVGFKKVDGIKSLKKKLDSDSNKWDKNVIRGKLKVQEALKKKELQKVSKLTHDQIQKEKVEVGKAFVKDFMISAGITVALLPTTGFFYIQTPDDQAIRSRMRMGS